MSSPVVPVNGKWACRLLAVARPGGWVILTEYVAAVYRHTVQCLPSR